MKNIIDEEQLEKTIEKMQLFSHEQSLSFQEIMRLFQQLDESYQTNNTKKIKDRIIEVKKEEEKNEKNAIDYRLVLENTIRKYRETAQIVEQKFNDIEKI